MRIPLLLVVSALTACAAARTQTTPTPMPAGNYRFRVEGNGITRVVVGKVRFEGGVASIEADGCSPVYQERADMPRLGTGDLSTRLDCGAGTSVWLLYNNKMWSVGYRTTQTVRDKKTVCVVSTVDKNGKEVCTRTGFEFDEHDVPTGGIVALIPDA